MAENGTRLNVAIPMPSGKRTIFIIGVLLMSASFTAAGYSGGVVLPTRLAEIGSMDYYAIISSMSTLGMMLVLPLVGKIADIFGCKAVAIFGIVLQLCARIAMIFIADTIVFMVVYAASSIGGGMFVTAPYVMIATVVNAEERPRFYGLIATFNALGALVFPLVAGAVVDAGFTTLGFVVYAPLCILGGAAILSLYPNLKGRPNSAKFDLLGIILLVISICCIVVWLSLGGKAFAFTSSIGLALLIVGIVAVALLIRVELKSENPSIPIRMFAKKRFTSAFLCQTLLACYSTCSAGWVIVYVQQMMQGSSTMSSTVTMPQTIVIAILGVVLGGYLGKNFAKRFRLMGVLSMVSVTVAALIFFFLTPTSPMIQIWVATGLGGVGSAIVQTAYTPFFQSELKPEEYSAGQGMYSFGSTGGACIFGAIAGAVINLGFGFNKVFLVATVLCAFGLVIALIGFRFTKEEIEASTAAVAGSDRND